MCGIVGYIGRVTATQILVEGLARLEYRGYDSAGMAVAAPHGAPGPQGGRAGRRPRAPPCPSGSPGHDRHRPHPVGHPRRAHRRATPTRTPTPRATSPSSTTASSRTPPSCGPSSPRASRLRSDTDTEVLAQLVARLARRRERRSRSAVREALPQSSRAPTVWSSSTPPARRASSWPATAARSCSGIGDGEMFVASDVAALVRHTDQVVLPRRRRAGDADSRGYAGLAPRRPPTAKSTMATTSTTTPRGGHAALHAQGDPRAAGGAVAGRCADGSTSRFATAHLDGLRLDAAGLRGMRRVKILGCGSALLRRPDRRRPRRGARPHPRRRRDSVASSGTATRWSTPRRSTSRSASPARPSTPSPPSQELQRKGGRVVGVVNVVGSAIARAVRRRASSCTPAPRCRWRRPRPSRSMAVAFALLALLLGRVRDLASARRRATGRRAPPRCRTPSEAALAVRRRGGGGPPATPTRGRCSTWAASRGGRRPRGRTEAQGDLLRPRRGLPGRGAEARPAGPGRRRHADGGRRPRRRAAGEEHRHHRADPGPQRAGDRGDRTPTCPTGSPTPSCVCPGSSRSSTRSCSASPCSCWPTTPPSALGRDIDKPRNLAKSVTVE